ncbi:MAG: hypothetical protein WCK98_01430 [bacterium]
MSIFLPRIKGNNLFTPTILIFGLLSVFYVSSLDFAEKSYNYSFIFATSILLLLFKVLVTSFGNIETELKNKKWFLVGSNIILLLIQVFLAILAIQLLTENKYPQSTLLWILISNLGFFVQTFLGKLNTPLKLAIVSIVIYSISFVFLYFKLFENTPERFILLQQTISYISLIVEACLFFASIEYYVDLSRKMESSRVEKK